MLERVKDSLDNFKKACDHAIIYNRISESSIFDLKINYYPHSNRFKYRTKDFKLPEIVLGDVSDLNAEQLRDYINILKNATRLDQDGKIIGIGVLDSRTLANLLGGTNNARAKKLNILNQRIARHLLGYKLFNEYHKSIPIEALFRYHSPDTILQLFITGSISEKGDIRDIQDLVEATFGKIHLARIFEDFPSNSRLNKMSDQYIIGLYKRYGEKCIGKDWDNNTKFEYFLSLLTVQNLNNDFLANQLLDRSFIYCSSLQKDIAIRKLFEFENKKGAKYLTIWD